MVEAMKGQEIIEVSAGEKHTAFLTKTGQLYVCGNSDFGQIGRKSSSNAPIHLDSLTQPIIHVACGSNHTLCLTDEGILCSSLSKELGNVYGFGAGFSLGSEENAFSPTLLASLSNKHIHKISAGSTASAALSGIDNSNHN